MTHKRLTSADYHALAEFRYRLRLFQSFSEKAARASGVTPQQHQALLAIKGYGGALTVGALAEKLVIRPHSAVELADRMVEAGWVRRGTGDDGRQVTLLLTPAAEFLLEDLSRAHREELRSLLPKLASLSAP